MLLFYYRLLLKGCETEQSDYERDNIADFSPEFPHRVATPAKLRQQRFYGPKLFLVVPLVTLPNIRRRREVGGMLLCLEDPRRNILLHIPCVQAVQSKSSKHEKPAALFES